MKVRVGVGLGTTGAAGLDTERFWAVVDACEAQGWDSIWFSERVGGDVPDPLAAMAGTAGRTRRLKFGPSVLVLPGRNPVLLAKELATIDVLSGGRLVAAFGLGAPVAGEAEVFGVPRADRAAMADEATVLIRRLWTEDAVTFEGRFFRVRDLSLRPKPVQDDPTVDIWFGGHSKAAARRVGRLGDGWLPSFIAPWEYKARADEVRATAADHGREVDEEHYGALVPWLGSTDAPGADRVMELAASRRPGLDPAQLVAAGFDGLRGRLEEFVSQGASKFVVVPVLPPDDWPSLLSDLRERVAAPLES